MAVYLLTVDHGSVENRVSSQEIPGYRGDLYPQIGGSMGLCSKGLLLTWRHPVGQQILIVTVVVRDSFSQDPSSEFRQVGGVVPGGGNNPDRPPKGVGPLPQLLGIDFRPAEISLTWNWETKEGAIRDRPVFRRLLTSALTSPMGGEKWPKTVGARCSRTYRLIGGYQLLAQTFGP